MESKVIAVCVIVGLLGAVAAALSFAAEAKRIKASRASIDYSGCSFPRSTVYGLGIGALLALILSQIIIGFQISCCTSKYANVPINWTWFSASYSFVSRIALGIAIALLVAAISITRGNGRGRKKTYTGYNFTYTECYAVKPGVFAAAGIFSLVSVAFGILFYLTVSAGRTAAANTSTDYTGPNSGVPLAATGSHYDVEEQPQIPTNKPY